VCNGAAKVTRGDYRFTESGLKSVVLKNVELVQCGDCGAVAPRIPRLDDLMRAIALALIAKPYKLRGEDIRFLRKYLRMNGCQFAKLLSVAKSTFSRWENDEQILGPQSDRLIRLVVLTLGEGLREKADEVQRFLSAIKKSGRKVRLDVDPVKATVEYTVAA
jgi:YgiT-type zinc finger domain-containing protein